MKQKMQIIFSILAIIISLGMILWITIFLRGKIESIPKEEIKKECQIKQEIYEGRNVYVVTPNELKEEKVILYIHGGSYMGNLDEWYWNFIKDLAIDTGYCIIVPDYPLIPNYHYDDVFSFMEPLYKEIVEKVTSQKLILIGDSAGGGLSLALIQKMGEEEVPIPNKTVLISPWLDVRMENPEIKKVQEKDTELNIVNLKLAGISYAGKNGMKSYLVNPVDGPVKKLQNVIIYTGTYDILNPDVKKLVTRAKEQGITIHVEETQGAQHNWIIDKDNPNVYHAKEDYDKLIQEIKRGE